MRKFLASALLVIAAIFWILAIALLIDVRWSYPLWPAPGFTVLFAAGYLAWHVSWKVRASAVRVDTPVQERISRWNRQLHAGIGWMLLAMATLLSMAYWAQPVVLDGGEIDGLSLAVFSTAIDGTSPDDIIYVRDLQSTDVPESVLTALRKRHSSLRIGQWSERPDDQQQCQRKGDLIPIGACGDDNFIAITDVSMPLWRIAVVDTASLACGSTIVFGKGIAGWRYLFHLDGFCT